MNFKKLLYIFNENDSIYESKDFATALFIETINCIFTKYFIAMTTISTYKYKFLPELSFNIEFYE